MSPATARCPICAAKVDRRQGSPTRPAHAVILYPCLHWLSIEAAEEVARQYQALLKRINEEG